MPLTKITVEPRRLKTEQLWKEHKYIPSIFRRVVSAVRQGHTPKSLRIPEVYNPKEPSPLFFYDKCIFLLNRHNLISMELSSRGFRMEFNLGAGLLSSVPRVFLNDWSSSSIG